MSKNWIIPEQEQSLSNLTSTINIFHKLQESIRNHTKLNIMLIGEFSTGKSTIINALLGSNQALTSALSTTSTITKFIYGNDSKNLTIYFKDGSCKKVPVSELQKYTAKIDGKTNHQQNQIKYVVKEVNSPLLTNLNLIDSPGINDTDEFNVQTANNFVYEVDAFCWIFSVDSPCKDSEVQAIKNLIYNTGSKPLAIINKIDNIDEDEGDSLEDTLDYFGKILKNTITNIIPVSAADELISSTSEFKILRQELNTLIARKDILIQDRLIRNFLLLNIDKLCSKNNQTTNDSHALLKLFPYEDYKNPLVISLHDKLLNPLTLKDFNNEFFSDLLIKIYVKFNILRQRYVEATYHELKTSIQLLLKLEFSNDYVDKIKVNISMEFLNYIKHSNLSQDTKQEELIYWYKQLIDLGETSLCSKLALVYASMDNLAKATNMYLQAYKYGDITALLRVADLYFKNQLYAAAFTNYEKYYSHYPSLYVLAQIAIIKTGYLKESYDILSLWSVKNYAPKLCLDFISNSTNQAKTLFTILCQQKTRALEVAQSTATNLIQDTITLYEYLILSTHKIPKEFTDFKNKYSEFYPFLRSYPDASNLSNSNIGNYLYSIAMSYFNAKSYTKSLQFFTLAETLGCKEALFRLGYIYQYGCGTTISPTTAINYYTKSIEVGLDNKYLFYHFAKLQLEKSVCNNPTKAFIYFNKASQLGLPIANFQLAKLYEEGKGCTQNKVLAYNHMKKACATNSSESKIEFIKYTILGIGCIPDIREGMNLIKKYELNKKHIDDLKHNYIEPLGSIDDLKNTETLNSKMSSVANHDKFIFLAQALYYGYFDIMQDKELAKSILHQLTLKSNSIAYILYAELFQENKLDFYEKALLSENIIALPFLKLHYKEIYYDNKNPEDNQKNIYYSLFKIGLAHYQNKGYGTALKFLQKASQHDVHDAYFYLAIIYDFGYSTLPNYEKAVYYYKLDINYTANPISRNNLGTKYLDGKGVPKNYKTAFELFLSAAKDKECYAFYNLGLMCNKGLGCDANHEMAYKYFQKAISLGHNYSYIELAKLELSGLGCSPNIKLAFEHLDAFKGNDTVAVDLKQQTLDDILNNSGQSPLSTFFHAQCKEFGLSMEQNIPESISLYKQALELGCLDAGKRLSDIYVEGNSHAPSMNYLKKFMNKEEFKEIFTDNKRKLYESYYNRASKYSDIIFILLCLLSFYLIYDNYSSSANVHFHSNGYYSFSKFQGSQIIIETASFFYSHISQYTLINLILATLLLGGFLFSSAYNPYTKEITFKETITSAAVYNVFLVGITILFSNNPRLDHLSLFLCAIYLYMFLVALIMKLYLCLKCYQPKD